VVRGEGHIARIRRRALTEDISPVLLALVADRGNDDSMPSGERDAQGRYVLDGPTNTHAFNFLVECVRRGGQVGAAEMAEWMPDLDSRLEACRNVDYYLLPGPIKSQLTKLLLSSFSLPTAAGSGTGTGASVAALLASLAAREVLDASKLGLCRSEMILDTIHLEGLHMRGLQLENSHVKHIVIRRCKLSDCDFALSVTAGELQISKSRLDRVQLGVFSTKVSLDEDSELTFCNIRVVEDLFVRDVRLHNCTFQGSDEDRKDRQVVSAAFYNCEIHGDVRLPFDRIVCEGTYFHGETLQMTRGGAMISFAKTRIRSLPCMESEGQVHLCLEDCQLTDAVSFNNMNLNLRNVHFAKPCEFVEVVFVDKVCDLVFPKKSKFRQVRFKDGLHCVIASGCAFEGCNLGYGQDALSDCLLTQCSFRACRFPFLEADSPVANLSGCTFASCRIQWSGQFAHEESFVINSHWLRKWNLAGSTVGE